MDLLPSISIVIPTYKRVAQTRKTIERLYQSRGWNACFHVEVIIADSTESDEIRDSIKDFVDPPPLYVRPSKTGIASNKNKGARAAKNEILIFCDSDMEVETDTLFNTLTYLKEHPTVAQVTGYVIWKGGELDGQLDRPRKEDRIENINSVSYIEAIYSRYMATYKSLFWQVGGYDEEIFNMRGEGSDLSIRYWRNGLPLAFWKRIKVHHVYKASDTATRNIDKPEKGIIRDLILLAYKYGLDRERSENFAKTLKWLTDTFGNRDKYIIIESISDLLPYYWEIKDKLQKAKEAQKNPLYDFKFLDIFTEKEKFLDCLNKAEEKLKKARQKAFGEFLQ